ncbi:MAG: indole-3-glycerol phosphate synthase TrpC, partial [Clostridia bacterium]
EAYPMAEVRSVALSAPRGARLSEVLSARPISLIAEVKRASPSRGLIKEALDALELAKAYVDGGADAISVLTEPDYFQGSFDDLRSVRSAVEVPLLCKDFIFCPYQVYRARAAGADAILLIAAILSDDTLRELSQLGEDLGMDALVEVHDAHEMRRVRNLQAGLVGINNRDLSDFSVNLQTFESLAPGAPDASILVAESGIHSAADVRRMRAAGARGVLVGEMLVRSSDPAATVRDLLSGSEVHQ